MTERGPLHERYARAESPLRAEADADVWASAVLDGVTDAAPSVVDGAQWQGTPEGAPRLYRQQCTATLALCSLALRQAQVVGLVVRSGYAPEAHSGVRRLQEAAGHAAKVASDPSGQYAWNWIQGRGKAGSPRIAFSRGGEPTDAFWGLVSNQSHADFEHYLNLTAKFDGGGTMHNPVFPERDPVWDNILLWLAAHNLCGVLAAACKVHEHIDQTELLAAGQVVHGTEDRLAAEVHAATEAKRQAAA